MSLPNTFLIQQKDQTYGPLTREAATAFFLGRNTRGVAVYKRIDPASINNEPDKTLRQKLDAEANKLGYTTIHDYIAYLDQLSADLHESHQPATAQDVGNFTTLLRLLLL